MSWNKIFVGIIIIGLISIIVLFTFTRETTVPRSKSAAVNNSLAPAKTPGPDMVIKNRDGSVNVTVSEKEGVALINELFAAIDPSNPENDYMTPLMKEKIGWVYDEIAAKRLVFTPSANWGTNLDGSPQETMLMSAVYDQNRGNIPTITLFVPRLLTLIKSQHRLASGFNASVKNTFALTLTHEAIHLEQGADFFLKAHNPEEILTEETRAWSKVSIMAVRGLRKKSQPLEPDYIIADDILQKCKDNNRCDEFQKFMKGAVPTA